jgi:hypothetical protein
VQAWEIRSQCGLWKPLSRSVLEKELGLPQSTIYRKIGTLRESGLLMVDSFALKSDGKREAAYICTFREILFKAEGGELQVEVVESRRSAERRWFKVFFEGSTTNPAEPHSDESETF